MVTILLSLTIFSLFQIVNPALSLNLSPKLFRVSFFAPCPPVDKFPIRINQLEFAKKPGKANIYTTTAELNVTKIIYEPIEVNKQ